MLSKSVWRRLVTAAAVGSAILTATACTTHHTPTPTYKSLPDCVSLRDRLGGGALGQPVLRSTGSTPSGLPPASEELCPLLGLASDGKTSLQVLVWMIQAAPPSDGPQALGSIARQKTDQFCTPDTSVTTGNPITESRCFTTSVMGSIAAQAVVHGSVVIAVRIDADHNADRQVLQNQAQQVTSTVASAI